MKLPIRHRVLAIAIASILTLAPVAATFAATGAEITAARQEGQIWATYALSPFLRANDISIRVVDGRATLTGIVDEEVNRELAGELALGIDGIRTIDNRIEVKAGHVAEPVAPRSVYTERVEDATVSAAVRSKLAWSQQLNDGRTRVTTTRGRVTLKGEVSSAADKDLAQRLAAGTRGVASVDNQLRVAPMAAKRAGDADGDTAVQSVADAWITTKVKSTFMFSDNVDGNDIGVTTDSGKVTLTGTVGSRVERALAIELAKNVRGVTTVSADALAVL